MLDLLNPANLFSIAFEVLIKSFFAIAIIKTLELISPQNRRIVPGLVWLIVIPGFNLLCNFFVAIRLSESLKNELDDRDFEVSGRPTLLLGLAYAIISVLPIFLPAVTMPANTAAPTPADLKNLLPSGILGLASIVLFIQYWIKIIWYKKVLVSDDKSDNSTNTEYEA